MRRCTKASAQPLQVGNTWSREDRAHNGAKAPEGLCGLLLERELRRDVLRDSDGGRVSDPEVVWGWVAGAAGKHLQRVQRRAKRAWLT